MTRYTSLDKVIPYVPETIREQYSEAKIKQLALDYLRRVPNKNRYVQKTVLIPVSNHNAEIPEGLTEILSVWYLDENPCEEITPELCSSVDTEESSCELEPTQPYCPCLWVYTSLFWDSPYFTKKLFPLRYSGVTQTDKCIVNEFKCQSDLTWAIDTNDNIVTPDFETGYIAVLYLCEPRRGKEFLVPDLEEYFIGAANWITYIWLRDKALTNHMYFNQPMQYLQLADQYLNKFRGRMTFRGLSMEKLKALQNNFDLLKSKAVWGYRDGK